MLTDQKTIESSTQVAYANGETEEENKLNETCDQKLATNLRSREKKLLAATAQGSNLLTTETRLYDSIEWRSS